MATRVKPQLITRGDELSDLIVHLREEGSFAYDSEFIGELTYLPKLCLIQAASKSRIALIDPLADLDVNPFWELVTDPSIEKIVHAGEQDVEPVFRAIGKPPANLFDTQIAGGFVGLSYPLSLSKLVYSLVGAKLSKGLTFTNWEHRPLSDSQLRYAADDVRYLPAVRHEMAGRLEALGHAAWAAEESNSLAEPTLYLFNPETQWMKIRGGVGLPSKQQAILRELTILRNAGARQEDVPPRSFLRDEILIDLARSPVQELAGLERVRGLPRPVEEKYGPKIIEATKRALSMPPDKWPSLKVYEPTPREKFSADALCYAMECLCAGRQIDPSLVMSRQEIGELYRRYSRGEEIESLQVMTGWRRKAVGEQLIGMMEGRVKLSVGWTEGSLKAESKKL